MCVFIFSKTTCYFRTKPKNPVTPFLPPSPLHPRPPSAPSPPPPAPPFWGPGRLNLNRGIKKNVSHLLEPLVVGGGG